MFLFLVLIEVENEPHPRVSGGPLDGNYVFSQMHFHWGDNDTLGSEDKINHRRQVRLRVTSIVKATFIRIHKPDGYNDI